MLKYQFSACIALLAVGCCWIAAGCSSDPGLPPQASKEQILAGAAARAKPVLDAIEKEKPENRQALAENPHMAQRLQDAAADPETKKRMTDLGIHMP